MLVYKHEDFYDDSDLRSHSGYMYQTIVKTQSEKVTEFLNKKNTNDTFKIINIVTPDKYKTVLYYMEEELWKLNQ